MRPNRTVRELHTIAVARTSQEARDIATRLERAGVPPWEIHIGRPVDENTERRAEARAG